VCGTDEITGKNYETFTSLNTVAFGISVDTTPSKKAWPKSQELNTLNFFMTNPLEK